MKILLRSRLFQKLSLLISVTALISAGIDSLMAFYLNVSSFGPDYEEKSV